MPVNDSNNFLFMTKVCSFSVWYALYRGRRLPSSALTLGHDVLSEPFGCPGNHERLHSKFQKGNDGRAVRLAYRRGLPAVPGDLATRHGHKEGDENNWSCAAHGACAKSNDD